MKYALDTSAIVLALREQAEMAPNQVPLWKKTHAWLESLPATTNIVFPAPALGEVLYGLKDASRVDAVIDQVVRRFEVVPFDLEAARVFAELAREYVGPQARRTPDWRKHKVDLQIIAIAIRSGANRLVTEDKDQRNTATKWIQVTGIPDPPPRRLRLPGL